MRLVPLVVLFCLLSGCAVPLTRLTPQPSEPSRSYVVGVEQTATTGDPVLRVRRLSSIPAYTPTAEFTLPRAGAIGPTPTIRPGQVWTAESQDAAGNYLLVPDPASGANMFARLHITPDGYVGRGWLNIDGSKPIQGSFPEGVRMVPTEGAALPGSFVAELVYSGRSGDTIRLLYREYSDDLVRAAFTQDLTYDLSESPEIRFRSIVIEVREANSSGITYTVKDDGGLSWLPG